MCVCDSFAATTSDKEREKNRACEIKGGATIRARRSETEEEEEGEGRDEKWRRSLAITQRTREGERNRQGTSHRTRGTCTTSRASHARARERKRHFITKTTDETSVSCSCTLTHISLCHFLCDVSRGESKIPAHESRKQHPRPILCLWNPCTHILVHQIRQKEQHLHLLSHTFLPSS